MRIHKRKDSKSKVRVDLIANHIFRDYTYDGNFAVFMFNLHRYLGVVKAQLKECILMENVDVDALARLELPQADSVEDHLMYISDRFNCSSRLQYLVSLADWYQPTLNPYTYGTLGS